MITAGVEVSMEIVLVTPDTEQWFSKERYEEQGYG